jgi:antitoxin component of MazEF toxin-antitoxin module
MCHVDSMVLVSPSTLVNKANAVTGAAVHVTLHNEIPVCCPAITDDCSTRFDPL